MVALVLEAEPEQEETEPDKEETVVEEMEPDKEVDPSLMAATKPLSSLDFYMQA